MFNISYYDLKKSKKQYSHNLRNTDMSSYRLHEKMSTSLNHSLQSNISETTASKSNTTKTFCKKNNNKIPMNTMNSNKIKGCSYLDFLELRKTKNSFPIGTEEKRFKWQNLRNENIVIYPEIYKKPHKKQHLLKETFGEGILGFMNNRKVYDNNPKIRRLRRCHSDQGMENNIQINDINTTRRVIDPFFNKEKEKNSRRRPLSQTSRLIPHKTDGGIKSLFELTPIDIPIKGKKLFRAKSYGAMNLFDKNYGQYQMPTHTKKIFLENRCYYDHIKDQGLITNMSRCWKKERSRSVGPEFKTDIQFLLDRNIFNLGLRYYGKNYLQKEKNWNKTTNLKSRSKIKRNNIKKQNKI